jgi:hypothetical protein
MVEPLNRASPGVGWAARAVKGATWKLIVIQFENGRGNPTKLCPPSACFADS